MSLNTLADHLSARYKKLGAMEDLDEAIVLDQEALNLFLQGHHDQSTSLSNIADHLSSRYKQLRAMEDLDEAIGLVREALDLCPHGHPDRSISLNSLADCLSSRYNQLGASISNWCMALSTLGSLGNSQTSIIKYISDSK